MPVGDTRGRRRSCGCPRGRAALTLRAWWKAPGRGIECRYAQVFPFLPPWKSIGEESCEPHQTGKRSRTARWLDRTNDEPTRSFANQAPCSIDYTRNLLKAQGDLTGAIKSYRDTN